MRRAQFGSAPSDEPMIDGATQVAVGVYHACALLNDRSVRCWGGNAFGQLGDGTTTDRDAPVRVEGLPPAAQIVAGARHTCARSVEGRVLCWGANGDGQLGDGTTDARSRPVAVTLPPSLERRSRRAPKRAAHDAQSI